MTQVLITDTKLDTLAQHIASKAEVSLPLTIDQMVTTVDGIEVGGAAAPRLQSKNATPSASAQTITYDTGYDGLSSVSISAVSSTTLNVSANGTYTANNGTFYSTVNVAIDDSEVLLQTKSVTPSNIPVSVTPDSGYHGLSSVTVNAIPSQYADVSDTTATTADVLEGKTFISSDGRARTGLLVVSSYLVGSSAPSNSTGNDGDIYLKI